MLRFDFKATGWPEGALCFDKPIEIVAAYSVDEVLPTLEMVSAAADRGLWAAGFVAYEAAPAFDDAFATHASSSSPLVWFGLFNGPCGEIRRSPRSSSRQHKWRPTIPRAKYTQCINEIREAAGRGDLYQANYTFPLHAHFTGDAYGIYLDLQHTSGCGFCAYLETEDLTIVSASPELFFHFNHFDRTIVTRPMKGTRTRGRWLDEDLSTAGLLRVSEKDRAENLMIVDLLRNDLGRIAESGTIEVPRLFELESYPTVWQMTSTITATARRDVSLTGIFCALFPCGSVTGAPKIAAMQKIAELERQPRGVYCGAMGMVRPGGDALFNVAIRTMMINPKSNAAIYQVGGGITWESNDESEYEEALSKAIVLTDTPPEFDLVETLRLESGEYYLLQRHIDRILDSARYFGRTLATADIEMALNSCAMSNATGVWRVRLLAHRDSSIQTECTQIQVAEGKQRFRLAAHPVSSQNRSLFHKTTNRRAYAHAAAEIGDLYDVLLSNERGELTEFTRGNLVIEIDDTMLTPPIKCGLLAGTLRAEMLAVGIVVEQVISREELVRADRIWFINSVRGWIEMEQTSR